MYTWSMNKWIVVDEESVVGGRLAVLGEFDTEDEAVQFIGGQKDQAKVERGGFGIDPPAED